MSHWDAGQWYVAGMVLTALVWTVGCAAVGSYESSRKGGNPEGVGTLWFWGIIVGTWLWPILLMACLGWAVGKLFVRGKS